MNFRLCLASLVSLVGVSACGGDGDASPVAIQPPAASSPASASTVGPLGVVEDKTPGLIGVDANQNGIRDDVDALITKTFSGSDAKKKAAEQYARAVQATMQSTTTADAIAAAGLLARSINCTFATVTDITAVDIMTTDIEALTANTKERRAVYFAANNLAAGQVLHSAVGQTCD